MSSEADSQSCGSSIKSDCVYCWRSRRSKKRYACERQQYDTTVQLLKDACFEIDTAAPEKRVARMYHQDKDTVAEIVCK